MNATDIVHLSRLLEEVLDLDADRAEAWFSAMRDEDRRFAPELREILARRASAQDLHLLDAGPRLPLDEETAAAGDRVGPYRLVRQIGNGGMGTVWLAERVDGAMTREVALKLPRLAWGGGIARRMARERDIGALLEHPNIARLYDAGVDARGRPYLALEYVAGQTLDAWCASQPPSVRDRLSLFLQVARAVAYAHGRLIVHRDLKPSNVMVTPDGQAHLLDFGIAKLLVEEAADATQLTEANARVLTPQYAAPEQLRGELVTVVSDVYALGVLLYEMLAGQKPHEPRRASAAALEEAILEQAPQRASQRAKDRDVARQLRGDIDAILAKALRSDPAQRYATVDAMAQDIERFLAGERVLARPDSPAYRLRKAFGRHRVGFAALAAAALSLIVGSGIALEQARRAEAAARLATAEAQRERAVKDFVVDVFRINSHDDPNNNAARQLPVELLIERAAKLIDAKFEHQPDLQAELYGVVGDLSDSFPDGDLAVTYAAREIEALARFPASDEQRVHAFLRQARALRNAQRPAQAEAAMRQALVAAAGAPALQLQAHIQHIRMLEDMARLDEAGVELAAAQHLADRSAGLLAADQAYFLYLRAICVQLCKRSGERYLEADFAASTSFVSSRSVESMPLYAKALAMSVAAVGNQAPQTLEIRTAYMRELAFGGHVAESKKQLALLLQSLRAAGGPDEVRAAAIEVRQMTNFFEQDAVSFAELVDAIHRDQATVVAYGARLPPAFRARVDFRLGDAYSDAGDIADAEAMTLPAARELLKLELSAEDRQYYLFALGWTAMFGGRHAEAAESLREATELRKKIRPDSWKQGIALQARNLSMQGRFADAEALIAGAEQRTADGKHDPYMIDDLARIRLDSGDATGVLELLAGDPAEYSAVAFEDSNTLRAEALCATGREREGLALVDTFISLHAARTYAYQPALARLRAVEGLCAARIGLVAKASHLAAQAREAFERQPGVSPWFKAPLQRLEQALHAAATTTGRTPHAVAKRDSLSKAH